MVVSHELNIFFIKYFQKLNLFGLIFGQILLFVTTLLRKLSWDSDTDERADLGLEDGTQMKVQVGTVFKQ